MKEILLKWFLRFSGLVQIGYWGASHLFFPQWYLRSVGLNALAENPGSVTVFLNEIGVLTIGLGTATILASFDPVRNFAVIIVLYLVAVGSMLVSLYHISSGSMAAGEWITIAIIFVQTVILSLLFPWSRLRMQHR
jgi:hypothetical protein